MSGTKHGYNMDVDRPILIRIQIQNWFMDLIRN